MRSGSGHRVRKIMGMRAVQTAAGLAILSACSVSSVMSPRPEVDVGVQTAAIIPMSVPAPPEAAPFVIETIPPVPVGTSVQTLPPPPLQTLPPAVAPVMVAYPRLQSPAPPSLQTMDMDEIACRKELKRIGATFRDLSPINQGGACRIDHPVQLSMLSGGIRIKPAATLTCRMALTFAQWTKNELAPAARRRYFSGVDTIHQGSSYSCRNIRDARGVASEHSKGNALDIMRIELNSGRDIDVRKPGWFAFRQRGFLNTVRKDGCDYFSTVLGTGYNADHADHFHFDIKGRRNGYVACR